MDSTGSGMADQGHNGVVHYTVGAKNVEVKDVSHDYSCIVCDCPHCGARTNAAVVAHTKGSRSEDMVIWSRCMGCSKGIVHNQNEMAPAPLPAENVEGLPAEVASAYLEARKAMGMGAHTSTELMCRKILMHCAVDKGAREGETFVAYLDYLVTTGYVTPPMRPWLDLIKNHGNQSTHRLQAATEERARNTLAFTTQLLRLVYEMDHKAQSFMAS